MMNTEQMLFCYIHIIIVPDVNPTAIESEGKLDQVGKLEHTPKTAALVDILLHLFSVMFCQEHYKTLPAISFRKSVFSSSFAREEAFQLTRLFQQMGVGLGRVVRDVRKQPEDHRSESQ
jgi:hypothetical protein